LHHSDNAFAPLLVWQADDGTILNGFVGLKGVLNFDGIDVEAANNDHVFCPIDDVKEIVDVQVSDITRMMPAVHGGLRCCFGVSEKKAKLVGLLVHRRETGNASGFEQMTDISQILEKVRQEAGLEAAEALAKAFGLDNNPNEAQPNGDDLDTLEPPTGSVN
jgi:hypothetical protein